MASERQMPSVGKVISGTHGYFWWNNSICYEITSFEAKIKTNRETINFSGQMWDDSKLMGVSGTWSAKIIIEPEVFDTVQKLMQKTKNKKGRQSCTSIFSSKIKCGDCGEYYGSKVWHSNDKYRRVIWRCNHKFDNEKKCTTPHLDENRVKEIFIAAVNKLIESKAQLLSDFSLIKNELFDTTELVMERNELERELENIAEQVQECIDQNARVAQNQAEYELQYNELVGKYDRIKAKVDELNITIADKKARKTELELFMKKLKKQDKATTEFDEGLWISMVECVTVYAKDDVRVEFKNGNCVRA